VTAEVGALGDGAGESPFAWERRCRECNADRNKQARTSVATVPQARDFADRLRARWAFSSPNS